MPHGVCTTFGRAFRNCEGNLVSHEDEWKPAGRPDPATELLRHYLADRDEPCPRCGYNLRQLQSLRCPECGDALRLRIALVEPRMAAYLTLLAVCAIALGGALLMCLLAVFQAPGSWWTEFSARILLWMLVLAGGALACVLRFGRWIRRRSTLRQWLLVSTAVLVFSGLATAFILEFDD